MTNAASGGLRVRWYFAELEQRSLRGSFSAVMP